MRKFIIALVLLLSVLFVITRFTEIQAIADTLRQGDWRFLALALIVQVFWLFSLGASFQAIYRIMGLDGKWAYLLRLATAARFVSVIAPSGGVSGISIFLIDARKRGYSTARAMVAGALFVLFEHAGFLCILTLGLFVLFRRNHLGAAEIIGSIISLVIALVIAILLFLAMQSAPKFGATLRWITRIVNRILWPFNHRQFLSEERATSFAFDASDGITAVRNNPRSLIYPFLLSIFNKMLLLVVFWLMFLAFKIDYTYGTVIAGFSIGYLFSIVSITPSGIGVVEGVLTLSLTSLGIPLGAVTVVVLAYRGYSFWFPLLIGMVALRSLTRSEMKEQSGFN